ADGTALAYRYLYGRQPTVIFLPGYMSDMAGGKATAVMQWAFETGQACLLLDYAGCGLSGGVFEHETLDSWCGDVLTVANVVTIGAKILVGSSMGGWLMLRAARDWQQRGIPHSLHGLVGMAAAPDFTDWGFTDAEKALIATEGLLQTPNDYGDTPTVTTRAFWQSGQDNLVLGTRIAMTCPVRLIHGQRDVDVPWEIALKLAAAIDSDDVRVALVKDGDHRLSRDQDIALMLATIAELVHEYEQIGRTP
ncbi:MAG: hypothetical protein RLZZ58_277, partial [Pseudomonadota bacterium]